MSVSTRTEAAIKKVIALKNEAWGVVREKPNGNHTIVFSAYDGNDNIVTVATFTLRSIIGKRLKKRSVK